MTTITGIVGTAKNTGKTTTLASLLSEAAARTERLGVTGIGYDGEEVDTVTGLPKPRLLMHAGTIAATSEACLGASTASFRLLRETETVTALGRVSIVEITSPGLLVLAGPNTKRLLGRLLEELGALGITRVLVDGSLNRIAAMSGVDSIIFTTGASRTQEIAFLSEEARAITGLFHAPQAATHAERDAVSAIDRSGTAIASLPGVASLLDAEDAHAAARLIDDASASLVIPKMVSLPALEVLVKLVPERTNRRPMAIELGDPTILLLAGEPMLTARVVETARERGLSIAYRHPIRAAAMTVNPFYPRPHEHTFIPAYIDKRALLDAVRKHVSVPVFNMREDGAGAQLYSLL